METLSALLAICEGIHRSPHERPVARSFYDFFDVCLNKRLNQQLPVIWEAMAVMWRHCNGPHSLSMLYDN